MNPTFAGKSTSFSALGRVRRLNSTESRPARSVALPEATQHLRTDQQRIFLILNKCVYGTSNEAEINQLRITVNAE